jgi:hypothetical protein
MNWSRMFLESEIANNADRRHFSPRFPASAAANEAPDRRIEPLPSQAAISFFRTLLTRTAGPINSIPSSPT